MAEVVERSLKAVDSAEVTGAREYVLKRYDDAIRYYWRASAINKRLYKWTRYLVVVFGAAVTLLASMSSSSTLSGAWATGLAIATPLLAAVLTIIGGLSQSFQWGPAWQEMVLTAQRLERERDRIAVTRSDPAGDLEVLNSLILAESDGFFMRILGSVQPSAARIEEPREVVR
jgi:hypothetical protein